MKTTVPLILASASPRRKQLLTDLGLEFEVMVRPTNEVPPVGVHPWVVAEAIAREKAEAFRDLAPGHLILAADTVVALGERLLAKPQSEGEALEMLSALSGRTHEVITGCALFHADRLQVFHEKTEVKFRSLEKEDISFYVDQYRPYDKAGAYGIQEWIGMIGIEGIVGDYYNVMGLPVGKVYQALRIFL